MSIYAFLTEITAVSICEHTQLLANHSSGHLLSSLQSAIPIQTERSERGLKQDRK